MNTLIASEPPQSPADDIDIQLEHVSVLYRVPRERMSGIKEYTIRWLQRRIQYEEFWALRDVNLTVRRGEVFGVIGRNGSGKSTLLKVISRVLFPTRGRVYLRGQVAPLLELGGGFHPELSGRENVYLNSALLGRSRADTVRLFPEIVEFAEISEFIDAPIRTYSTGMVARLGFAVATCVRPQILLVDEVLSVGDAPFQRKCLDRMDSFRKQGTTVVIVTHSMAAAEAFCDQAMWLDHGRVEAIGPVDHVVHKYIHMGSPDSKPEPAGRQPPLDAAQIARNILDCTYLDVQTQLYPTDGILDLSHGTVSAWVRFRSDRTHRIAILFHTDDSRYILYIGSHRTEQRGEDMPVLIARAGGNRRVLDTYFGAAIFPEAVAMVDHEGGLGGVNIPKDEWHMVTMTWIGYPQGIVRLYVDDWLAAEKGYDERYDDGRPLPTRIAIGMRPIEWTGEFVVNEDGTQVESPVQDTMTVADSELEMREVRLYRKTLGAEEIGALLGLGLKGK